MQTRALVFLALAAAASAFTAPTMGTRMQLRSSKAGEFFSERDAQPESCRVEAMC
jgi:hypothetical protein